MTLDFQWKMRKIAPPVWIRRFSRVVKSCLARSGRTPDATDFGDCPSTRHQQWRRKGYRRVTKIGYFQRIGAFMANLFGMKFA